MATDLWSKPSYAQRLFGWLLGYSLLLVGCFALFQYQREKDFKAEDLNSSLQIINAYIAEQLAEGTPPDSVRIDHMGRFADLRLSIIDPDGKVVHDNSLDRLPGGNHQNREEIAKARLQGQGYALRRHSESTGQYYFYSATRAANGMVVRTAVPYTVPLHHLLEADFTFLWIIGGLTVVFCLLGLVATRRLGQHITRLRNFAAEVEKGSAITDTEPFPHDELGDISNNIVRLYARLQQALADRDREHAAAMHQQQEKERIKKQLTNNINHELKTPVAAIKVCLETLLAHPAMDEQKRMDFLQRSVANTNRLRRLLTDVALITRIDDGGAQIQLERVNLWVVTASVAASCEAYAQERGMVIENNIDRDIYLQGNAQLLESVFYNLIDNALAYSGGTRISIDIEAMTADTVALSVADNGCGVAEEHLGRIFERFYRVDKGRSRSSGGTGLGLSIVKNAILLHGGSVTASNLKAGGLRFIITLPRVS